MGRERGVIEVHFGAATDVGRVREVNEDSLLAVPPVFVVADGMGGHEGGDVASGIVIEEFGRLARDGFEVARVTDEVAEVLRSCQRRIQEYGAEQRALNGGARWYAGTTVVAALLCEQDEGSYWLLVNLGDSRAYRMGRGGLEQVSVDHSVVQELVDAGELRAEDVATHPERHVITRALGGSGAVEPDFFLLPVESTGRLVLCSDGVTGMLEDDAIAAILERTDDPRDAADRVVAAAVTAGGLDNATAVVVDVVGWGESEDSYDPERQRLSLEEKLGALP